MKTENERSARGDRAVLLAIAALVVLLHLLTNSRYGFHRDEWQFLSDARHLDWGFVAYPPLTPFLERVALAIFGLSPVGLRLFSVLAQAACVYLAGDMARQLGGKRLAQLAVACVVAFSPLPLFEGTEFQYTSFDYLWWILICWSAVRLLQSGNPRWWLALGAFAGLGFLTKYAILFLIIGLLLGLLLTRERRYFASPWFWGSVVICALICMPNFLWQVRHHFIYLQFEHYIHTRDVGEGRADGYWRDQLLLNINLAGVPLVFMGLFAGLRDKGLRLLSLMAAFPVLLFALVQGRGYYSAGVYPLLLAMGAVVAERWLTGKSPWLRGGVISVFFLFCAVVGADICMIIVPLAPDGSLMHFALSKNSDQREEIGWPELVTEVSRIYYSLPPEQRAHTGIWAGNYGEYGSLEMLGPRYGLPAPFSTTNSAWYRGYPNPAPNTLIVLGVSRGDTDEQLTNCKLAGHVTNALNISNEESTDHPDIYLCGPPRRGWATFWEDFQWFG